MVKWLPSQNAAKSHRFREQYMIHHCVFCGSSDVAEAESLTQFNDRRKKQALTVRMRHMACTACDREFQTPEQSAANTLLIEAARRAAGGAPSPAEIVAMRKAMSLKQSEAGELFGGGPVAFSKYENGSIVPAQSMARLLSLAVAGVITRDDLERAANGTLIPRMATTVAPSVPRAPRVRTGRTREVAMTAAPAQRRKAARAD